MVKAFDRVLTPLEEFIHRQTTSGVLLMLCAIAALTIANSQWNDAYHHLLEMPFTIGVQPVQAPAQILERKMHLPSAYLIIPSFSLANAGIPIDWSSFSTIVTHPVSVGIAAGLLGGNLIGIAGFSWAAVMLGVTALPHGLNFKHIVGAGLMGGIGFTMSIFIAELGFAHHAEDLLMAKTGVLLASVLAGVLGFLWLYLTYEKSSDQRIQEAGDHPAERRSIDFVNIHRRII